jgi:hypothetical protein
MAELQNIVRILSAAGAGTHPDVKGTYLLYVEGNALVSKLWNGDSFGDQELIASSVRANSTAAYFLTPKERIVFYVSDSSELKAVRYDGEEEEWTPVKGFPDVKVAPSGQVAVFSDKGDIPSVFVEDSTGHVVYIDPELKTTTLPTSSVLSGTPLTPVVVALNVCLFYISSKDRAVHYVERSEGGKGWADKKLGDVKIAENVVHFLPIIEPGQNVERTAATHDVDYVVVALTASKDVIHISTKENKQATLGTVNSEGKLVVKTSAENSYSYGNNYGNTYNYNNNYYYGNQPQPNNNFYYGYR